MAQVSMPAADIGLPQLAMHSAYETAGTKDVEDLVKLTKSFFS
jgi:aspartyl aminopeptidase